MPAAHHVLTMLRWPRPARPPGWIVLAPVWASGCAPAVPEAAHGTIPLDGLIANMRAVGSDRRDQAQVFEGTQTFRLPAKVPHADLVLEGAWWTATVTVNGHALKPATGGYAPLSVPVGDWLVSGENTITVAVVPPGETVPSVSDGELRTFSALAGAPQLVLHGASWVREAGLVGDGARALVEAAPTGSRVAFTVWRDGVQVADLGTAPVVGGVARSRAGGQQLQDWDLGNGERALFWLNASLGSGDTPLDAAAFRTGRAEISVGTSGIEIAGVRRPLAGLRWSGAAVDGDLKWLAAAGLNTIELHGQPITHAFLDATDEAGVAVAIVQRCDGRIRQGGGTRRPIGSADPAAWDSPLLDAQDARALAAALRHPSVVLWVMEADQANRPSRIAGLAPDGRPVAGRDLPLLHGPPQPAGWQIEYTADVSQPEQQLAAAIAGGATGGILPGPPGRAAEGWLAGVTGALSGAGLVPPQPRTGAARVEVSGLKPGDVAWLEAPGAERIGAVAGADGAAHLSLWFEGAATVTVPGGTRPVVLRRGATVAAPEAH
ncbi:MAG: hypothetical protein EXR69_16065 [Myxococcales bacterium]|nr:hypothetical protein [Myxococcales bacterium]